MGECRMSAANNKCPKITSALAIASGTSAMGTSKNDCNCFRTTPRKPTPHSVSLTS